MKRTLLFVIAVLACSAPRAASAAPTALVCDAGTDRVVFDGVTMVLGGKSARLDVAGKTALMSCK